MTKVPVFHYTTLDNFYDIISNGQLHSRTWMKEHGTTFQDISIDPDQPVREEKGLLDYVPLFLGFHARYREDYNLHKYLENNYDDPKVQNPSFFGSLNKVLRVKLGKSYERVILLLINWDIITEFADKGYVRFFTDIAVKPDVFECDCNDCEEFLTSIENNIVNGRDIYSEIDVYDDGERCISIPDDIEVIIVDNENIKKELTSNVGNQLVTIPIFVRRLPQY